MFSQRNFTYGNMAKQLGWQWDSLYLSWLLGLRGNKQFDLISWFAAQGAKASKDTCCHRHFCWLILANIKWYLHRRENIVCLLLSPVVVIWKDKKISIETALLGKIARPSLHVCIKAFEDPHLIFIRVAPCSSFNLSCLAWEIANNFPPFTVARVNAPQSRCSCSSRHFCKFHRKFEIRLRSRNFATASLNYLPVLKQFYLIDFDLLEPPVNFSLVLQLKTRSSAKT